MKCQLLVAEWYELVPDFGQFMADVPETLRLLIQTTGVIVAHEDNIVSSPTTDESSRISLERRFAKVATSSVIALAEQQREDGSLGISRPFPEFGTSAEAPRTDDFLF